MDNIIIYGEREGKVVEVGNGPQAGEERLLRYFCFTRMAGNV